MNFNFIYIVQFLLVICIITGQSFGSDQPTVITRFGPIQGTQKSVSGYSYEEFLGIRYGQIPKRFRNSIVNTEHWNGILEAKTYGPKCTQLPIEGTSEDCLFINIWRPVMNQSLNEVSPLPVLLWVHGSGYQTGSSASSPGDIIAASGPIIVATVNYRLGAFGFLYGDTDEIQGNQGVSDVITALLWVRDNIGYFGGNPKQVTLGGHSAGSMISSMFPVLQTIDHSLYSRLFIWSGVSVTPMFIENTTIATAKTKLLATKVGCGPVPEGPLTVQVIQCLETVNASIIIEKNQDDDIKVIGGSETAAFFPVYGTPLIPKPLIDLFWSSFNSTNHQVTLINGIAKDEMAIFFRSLKPKTRAEGWSMVWEKLSYVKKDLTRTEMQPFYDFYFNGTVDGDEKSLQTALINFMNDYSFRCTSLVLSEVYSKRHLVHFTEFDYIIDRYGVEIRPNGPWHSDSVEIFFGDPFRPATLESGMEIGNYSVKDSEVSKRLIQGLIDFVSHDTSDDCPKIYFDKLKPEDKPLVREINYQDTDVKYDKQSICIQWSKLLGFDVTLG